MRMPRILSLYSVKEVLLYALLGLLGVGALFLTQNLLRHHGVQRTSTAPYSHEQAGKVERNIGTVVTGARANLHDGNMPPAFFELALECAAY